MDPTFASALYGKEAALSSSAFNVRLLAVIGTDCVAPAAKEAIKISNAGWDRCSLSLRMHQISLRFGQRLPMTACGACQPLHVHDLTGAFRDSFDFPKAAAPPASCAAGSMEDKCMICFPRLPRGQKGEASWHRSPAKR